MARVLEPCPTCRRHIAASETLCPMCGDALPDGWSPAREVTRAPRSGRAVRFAWRLFLATTTSACGARTELVPLDAAPGDAARADAAIAIDAGTDAAIARDAGTDADLGEDGGDVDAGDIAIYGAPPADRAVFPQDVLPPPASPRLTRKRRRRRR